MQIKNLKVDYSLGLAKHEDKRRKKRITTVLVLEKEKREEDVECRPDLMFVKKSLFQY